MDKTCLVITVIGALNWGCIGLFKYDLIAAMFGGQTSIISRTIFVIVGLAGLWCIKLLFTEREVVARRHGHGMG